MALKQRRDYFESEEGRAIKRALQSMTSDNNYNTASTYHPNGERYPNHEMPFVDKHMAYLNAHPQLDAWIYVANVKMGARLR